MNKLKTAQVLRLSLGILFDIGNSHAGRNPTFTKKGPGRVHAIRSKAEQKAWSLWRGGDGVA